MSLLSKGYTGSRAVASNFWECLARFAAGYSHCILLPLVLVLGCQPAATPPSSQSKGTAPTSGGASQTAAKTTAGHGYDAPPFDPVAENGPVFEGWPKPDIALVFSGAQRGYLEPCGCTGPGRQKGGIKRRHGFIKTLQSGGTATVLLDAGGLLRRDGTQSKVKFDHTLKALLAMGYAAAAVGRDDLLYLDDESRLILFAEAADKAPGFFLFANSAVDDLTGLVAATKVVEAGGKKFGVIGILGNSYQQELGGKAPISDPSNAVGQAIQSLQAQACDYLVLLANCNWEEAKGLANQHLELDFVAVPDDADEPRLREELLGTKTRLIDVGRKGMYVGVIGLFSQGPDKVRYQRVPLDSRWQESAEMEPVFKAYVDEVASLYQQEATDVDAPVAGLGVWPGMKHERLELNGGSSGTFAGARSCQECHKQAYSKWVTTHHAQATKSIETANPSRLSDPECISCHATGWIPQDYKPYYTGFVSVEKTPLLLGNGCENCHGPSLAHVEAERGQDQAAKQDWRTRLKLSTQTAEQQVCKKCHDHDNSPQFDFSKYWEKVAHPGKS